MDMEKIIMYDSPEAAQLKTMDVWVTHDGFICRDEQQARYVVCTHKTCECGGIMTKGWTKCDICRAKTDRDKYNNLQFKEWDGTTPVYDYNSDKYFFSSDEVEEWLEENEIGPESLRLVICSENRYHEIGSDYWEDILPEDGDLPKELQDKLNELNALLTTLPPASWEPGNIKTTFEL